MNKKKLLALVVAMATFAGNVQVFGASFTDIDEVPWDGAKTYINSVADTGLMAGDYNDNGKLVFRAKGVVTYCETMQLIYALSQKTSGQSISTATQTKWTSVMNGYKIPTWVQPAVAYGLENSIVTISDVPGFVNAAGKSTNATRQDVAVMFGRALKDYGTINSSASLSFKDAASVNSVAVPYVDLLNRLGIINGDTDGNFNPKKTVNRAEMAVFVSKSYDVMKSGKAPSSNNNTATQVQAGSITGAITAVTAIGNDTAITVNGGSATMSFTGSSTTPVLSGSARVAISTLAVGDKVVASYKGQDLVSVLVTSTAASTTTNTNTNTSTSEVSGTYASMSSSYIKIKVSSSTKTYNFIDDDSDNTIFYVDGSKTTYSKFEKAAGTDKSVRLVLDQKDEISKAYIEDTLSGTFVSISKSDIRLKVSGSSKTYNFVDDGYEDVTFKIDGSKSTYSKVDGKASTGDKVELTLDDDGDVEGVNLVTEDDDAKEGTFVSISKSDIEIKVSGSTKTYKFVNDDDDDVDFEIDGDDSIYSKVDSKASKGDTIKLALNDDGYVTKVNLVTDDDEDEIKGTFVSIHDEYITVKKTGSSSSTKYYYEDKKSSNTTFYYNDSSKNYSYIESHAESGDTVKLVMDDDEVIKVYITKGSSGDVSGKLSSLNSTRLKVSGKSDEYKFEDSDDCDIEIKDGRSSTIDDYDEMKEAYEDGKKMELEVTLNNDDEITEITGYVYEVDGEVTSVSTSDETIKVKTASTTVTYKLDNDVDIDNDNDYKDTVSGLKSAYDDNEDDMDVVLTLDKDGYVTDVNVDL